MAPLRHRSEFDAHPGHSTGAIAAHAGLLNELSGIITGDWPYPVTANVR